MFSSRRHQKLIEETLVLFLNDKIRDLFEKTVKMVSKIGYEGAGTVEFIEDGKFYFLEMNKVQIEHPVLKW